MATGDPREPLAPAPRHMRSRRLRREAPGSEQLSSPITQPAPPPRIRKKISHRSKRTVALILVILVAISITVLVFALIFIP